MKVTALTGTAVLLACRTACDATSQAQTAAAPTADPTAGVAASCTACHQGPLSLAGKSEQDVAAAIRAILTGARAHPPIALADQSETAVQALAERLSSTR
jgi:hypothetical protein